MYGFYMLTLHLSVFRKFVRNEDQFQPHSVLYLKVHRLRQEEIVQCQPTPLCW
jgi:hypothetical protein